MIRKGKISNGVKWRRFRVWLISLGAVIAIYLLYNWLSKTPRIEIDREPERFVADGNVTDVDGKIGMIGDVGVGTVRKAEYIHLNEQKQVDRVFGFEKLLHKTGNEWEIEKPYMNVFRRDFNCYLTADRGKVRVETVAGRPSPKDAKFTGNVVAHILPEASSDTKEGFLYLDDVTFISDKSQFTTPGPVKYVSENAQMLGNGLEFIYNEPLERLELLRIFHLESLNLKSSQTALFPTATTQARRGADANSRMQTEQTDKPVAADDSQKVKKLPAATTQASGQEEGEHYRCVFNKNVVIDGPEQLIFADKVLSINNILRPKASGKQPDKADPGRADQVKKLTTENAEDTEKVLKPNSVSSPNSVPEAGEGPVDIVITCDNGFVVTPMDSRINDTNSAQLSSEQLIKTAAEKLKQLKKTNGRAMLVAQKIDHSAATGDTVASGLSELTFYTSDLFRTEANDTVVPVKITARKKARFLPALNQAIFEGDCRCMMLREDANSQQKYTLSAPKLTVDLSRDKGKRPSSSAGTIEHLTASGGVVQLDTSKWAGEKLLGFTKLKCHRFDYDAGQQMFLATGPDGIMAVDNSRIAEPKEKVTRFSLRRPCYAVVRDFETLNYSLDTNQIIADAGRGQIIIDYFPIVQGQYGQQITVTAGHIEALLYETAGGRNELSTLRATDGVTYEEKDIEFQGSKLFYDAKKSIITVQGDESQPCVFNGALVDAIEYDLKTGKVKAEIVGPGVLQRKR